MEGNTSHQPYHDSPTSPQRSSPSRHHTTHFPSSSNSSSTVKPLPPLPHQAPVYEPYRDDPNAPAYRDDPTTRTYHDDLAIPSYQDNPPTPALTPSSSDDENIPLAYLLTPYPHEAPPSYSVAVRQTHSYRDTLIQYIPESPSSPPHGHPSVVVEIDPESGEVVSRTDDVRHGVEKVVAMFVVALALLGLSGVLGWIAFGWSG